MFCKEDRIFDRMASTGQRQGIMYFQKYCQNLPSETLGTDGNGSALSTA